MIGCRFFINVFGATRMNKNIYKLIRLCALLIALCVPMFARADIFDSIFSVLTGIDTNTLKSDLDIKGMNVDLQNVINKEINKEIEQLTGHSGYGTLNYDQNAMNWGNGSDKWESVVNLYDSNNSGLGQTMTHMGSDFPIITEPQTTFNPYTSTSEKTIDILQSKTTLAARASSQVAFDKIAAEEKVIATLNQQIEHAPNAKAAADLNNRLLAENANITLQVEKLLAVLVQQQAVESQGTQADMQASHNFYDITGK
jgi:hypothetical protein